MSADVPPAVGSTWPQMMAESRSRLQRLVPENLRSRVRRVPAVVHVNPVALDFALTALAQAAGAVGSAVVVSLMARRVGTVALAEYLLLKRVITWLQSGLQLGLGVALPRYVAMAAHRSESERASWVASASVILATTMVALTLLLNADRDRFAALLFGEAHFSNLVVAVCLFEVALAAHGAIYGYFRGRLLMNQANALQVWNHGLIPIAAVMFFSYTRSAAAIVNAMAVAVCLSSAVPGFSILRRARFSASDLIAKGRELLIYGLARVPGDFSLGALFALGPLIAAHKMPLSQSSSLLLGMALLTAITITVSPLGLILLGKVSTMLVEERMEEIRAGLEHLTAALMDCSVFICLQLLIVADVIVTIWVSKAFSGDMLTIRIVLLAVPAYFVYAAVRSAIDAATTRAYNAINTFVALLVFAVSAAALAALMPAANLLPRLAGIFVASLYVLAVLSVMTLRRLFGVSLRSMVSGRVMGVSVGIAGVGYAARAFAGNSQVLFAIVFGGASCAAFIFALLKSRRPWVTYVRSVVYSGTAAGGSSA